MKLIYKQTGQPVALGDAVSIDGADYTIGYFAKPHKPASEGKVVLWFSGNPLASFERYVSVIGAQWIDREDRR